MDGTPIHKPSGERWFPAPVTVHPEKPIDA
jgi:hypothetical protein